MYYIGFEKILKRNYNKESMVLQRGKFHEVVPVVLKLKVKYTIPKQCYWKERIKEKTNV